MNPYWSSECGRAVVYVGDCREVMPTLQPNQFQAVCADPPYELSFMSRAWDGTGVAYDKRTWQEVLRVAKPGAHLISFGGTRTWHRMTCAIEDAGWEVRDTVMWVYGSGFPKGQNVGNAIDKLLGAERGRKPRGFVGQKDWREMEGRSDGQDTSPDDVPITDAAKQWDGWNTQLKPAHEDLILAKKPFSPEQEQCIIVENLSRLEAQLCSLLSASAAVENFGLSQVDYVEVCDSAQWTASEKSCLQDGLSDVMGTSRLELAVIMCLNTVISWKSILGGSYALTRMSITEMKSDMIIDWKTLRLCSLVLTPHTILKAATSQPGPWWNAFGAGKVLNAVVASMRDTQEVSALASAIEEGHILLPEEGGSKIAPAFEPIVLARRPLIGSVAQNTLDHGCGGINVDGCKVGTEERYNPSAGNVAGGASLNLSVTGMPQDVNGRVAIGRHPANLIHDGSDEVVELFPDGAARYFYTAKADGSDRPHGNGAVSHPTVKPLDLMKYLVRLICVRGGTILDPFMGTGSTGCAAIEEGMWFVGIEQSQEYADLAVGRLKKALETCQQATHLETGQKVRGKGETPPRPQRL